MRICYSLDNYDRASGGAALAARGLAHYLAGLGHQLTILQPGADADYRDDNIQVHRRSLRRPYLYRQHDRDTLSWNRQWHRIVSEFLQHNPTDLLITQNRLLYSSVEAAAERNIPTLVWAHAYRIFCPNQFFRRDPLSECSAACQRCTGGLFSQAIRDNRNAYQHGLQRASLVMANSHYMGRVISHLTGLDAPVVYPTFDQAHWQQPGKAKRDQVLFIKPQERKGFSIFLEIARALPETRFMVAGKARAADRKALHLLKNVERIDWSNEMKAVYAHTRVLLAPSIWPEPFGRVFIEAACAGVPSVASNRGGIPEAVGDGGILVDDIDRIDNWLHALQQLDDAATLSQLASRARAHAQQFNADAIGQVLRDSLLQATGLDLHEPSSRN